MNNKSNPRLALVILTHTGYAKHLQDLLCAVTAQLRSIDQVILVVDGELPHPLPTEMINVDVVVQAKFDSPQSARNAGLARVNAPWVCYLDGDNIPSVGYFESMRKAAEAASDSCGVLYPGVVIRVTERVQTERVFEMPEWTPWNCVESSIVDTSSCWRTAALREAGGWFLESGMLDDYTTALGLWRAGWTGQRVAGTVSVLRHHGERRSSHLDTIPETLWHARRYAVMTLFAGRERPFYPLMNWLEVTELPPLTDLVWIDNSRSSRFHRQLHVMAAMLARRPEVQSITITRDNRRLTATDRDSIHDHVTRLYNRALAATTQEVIVTIEDDVIPPLDSLRRLVAPLQPRCGIAAVGGVYPSRQNPESAVASQCYTTWSNMPIISRLPKFGCPRVGMVAGGFTAWHGSVLRRFAPMRTQQNPLLGWDGEICARLNRSGWHVNLELSVRCQHLCDPYPTTYSGGSGGCDSSGS